MQHACKRRVDRDVAVQSRPGRGWDRAASGSTSRGSAATKVRDAVAPRPLLVEAVVDQLEARMHANVNPEQVTDFALSPAPAEPGRVAIVRVALGERVRGLTWRHAGSRA